MKRLLWRVRNEELPVRKPPRVAVVLIGTNDIVSPECTQRSAGNRTAAELRGLLVYMHRCVSCGGSACRRCMSPCAAHAADKAAGSPPLSLHRCVPRSQRAGAGREFCPPLPKGAPCSCACRRLPSTQLVAMGVLPKGQRWPNTCTPAISTANARLQAYARANSDWLRVLDVGDQFLTHQACFLE